MKFVTSLLLTALFAFALGFFLDWWSIALAAFIVAVCIPQRAWLAFLSGALGIGLLWGGYSLFLNQRNNGLLASKIAVVFPLQGNTLLLILITAFIGGLVGGVAALSGSYLRKAFTVKPRVVRRTEVSERQPEAAI